MSDRELLLAMNVKLDNIYKVLFGNGEDPRESISGRLQTLEDTQKASKRSFQVVTTLVALAVAIGAVAVAALK